MSYEWEDIFKESAGILALMGFIGVAGGFVLESIEDQLLDAVILLFLIPILNDVGGNLGAVLGARVSSALHTGRITPSFADEELKENIWLMMGLGFLVFFLFGSAMFTVGFFIPLGLEASEIFTIVIGAGFITIFLITIITTVVALWAFKKGLDPDNIVIPVETTLCDFIGVVTLALMVWLVIIR